MTVDIPSFDCSSVSNVKRGVKVDTYLKLLKLAKYSPIIALAVAVLLSEISPELKPLGVEIPKGEDASAF